MKRTIGTSSISTGFTTQPVTPGGMASWFDIILFQTLTRLRSRSSPTKKRTVTTAWPGRDMRVDVLDAVDLPQLGLERRGHQVLDLGRRRPGHVDEDVGQRHDDLRLLLARRRQQRHRPGGERGDEEEDRELRGDEDLDDARRPAALGRCGALGGRLAHRSTSTASPARRPESTSTWSPMALPVRTLRTSGAPVDQHAHALQLAGAADGRRRHEHGGVRAAGEAQAGEGAGAQRRVGRQQRLDVARAAARIGDRGQLLDARGQLDGRHADAHRQLGADGERRGAALGHVGLEAQGRGILQQRHRRARTGGVAGVDQARGDDAVERRPHVGLAEAHARLGERVARLRRLRPRRRGARLGGVEVLAGEGLLGEQLPGATEIGVGLARLRGRRRQGALGLLAAGGEVAGVERGDHVAAPHRTAGLHAHLEHARHHRRRHLGAEPRRHRARPVDDVGDLALLDDHRRRRRRGFAAPAAPGRERPCDRR